MFREAKGMGCFEEVVEGRGPLGAVAAVLSHVFLWKMSLAPPLRYRGTSLVRNSAPRGPYSRTVPRALRWPWGGGAFLMSEVLL